MKIGIPTETMKGEGRVALIPSACKAIAEAGHQIYVQQGAGMASGYSDEAFSHSGAVIIDTAKQLYEAAKLIVKVKQPLEQDLRFLKQEHILFSYLHLAANHPLIKTLCDIGLCAIPFESISSADGALPLLTPMSKIAGRIAAIRGASLLFRNRGGRGVLLGGVGGAETGRVVILGAGIAGSHATEVIVGLGAQVDVLDLDENKLQLLKHKMPVIKTHISTPEVVELLCLQADLVVGAVLLAGRRAPIVLKRSIIERMNPGSVIVDIAIDQGGCIEGIRATNSDVLCYVENEVIHSAVPNMPATVARTASQSLSFAVLPYVMQLSASTTNELDSMLMSQERIAPGLEQMSKAMAISHGEVVDPVLQQEIM